MIKISETFKIDSLRIRIPLYEVQIINEIEFNRYAKVDLTTGEQIENALPKDLINLRENGIPLKLEITKYKYFGNTKERYLILTINSKQLKELYFYGITKENVKLIYDYIIEKDFVYFSYESFLNSYAVDVDICKDKSYNFNCSFSQFTSNLKGYSKPESNSKRFNKKDNKGIQWSKRETSEYVSKPYIKIYSKTLDFIEHTKEFYDNYIKDNWELPKELIRIEFTIKALKHLKTFGINSNKLIDVLEISQQQRKEMLKNHLNRHLDTETPILINHKDGAKLNINDKKDLNSMELIIQNNDKLTIETVIELMCKDITERKQTLNETKNKLLKLYNERLKDHYIKRDKSTNELKGLLNYLIE